MHHLTTQRLNRHDRAAITALQAVLDAAPAFSLLVEGKLPDSDAAEQEFNALPPDMDYEDKFFFGLYVDGQMVGAADVIRGYPQRDCAFIGLLMFVESWQHQGLGKQALQYIHTLAQQWGCSEIRLGVVASNLPGLAFWTAQGFIEISRRPLPGYVADVILMSRPC